jgi:type IV pilus assembly protein PilC
MAQTNVTYLWQGADRRGNKVKGKITAQSIQEVKLLLRKQGISAQEIKKPRGNLLLRGKEKLSSEDICVITRQIATMLNAGVSVMQTLDMIAAGHAKQEARTILGAIADDVKAGSQMSQALRKHPQHFDELYCDLVASGEQSGALETIFDRIAVYKEKAEALKSKIKKAMFYPIAVVVVAMIVTTILLIYVVPQFRDIFASFGAELPVFTQFVLNISQFVQDYGLSIAAALVALSWAVKRSIQHSKRFADQLDAKVLKLPIVGEILEKAAVARFARTLATTFSAGVPFIQALNSAAGAAGNAVYRDAIVFIKKEVASGMQMHLAMRATSLFPDMVIQMVAIGEESGTVDDMLAKIADIYERQVDDMVDGLTSLLEPLIMAVLGVVIGGLIVAMYLPIFQMGNVV